MSEDDSVKHEGKWTRDDLPSVKRRVDRTSFVLDAVVDHLNAHHPKPNGSFVVMLEETHRAQRERDEALRKKGEAFDRAVRAERERDAAVARAEAAEADNADAKIDADPAVHVVRESDLPAARVDGDYYVVASAKGDYRWPQHGPSWWAGRAQDALAKAARYTALARLAADREAAANPVEAKAEELWEATREGGAPVAAWADAHEDAQAQFRVLARHLNEQEARDE